jgi:hypothetical protein
MKQKFIITDSEYDVQVLINTGWRIVSITPQHVSTASTGWLEGKFAILLEGE